MYSQIRLRNSQLFFAICFFTLSLHLPWLLVIAEEIALKATVLIAYVAQLKFMCRLKIIVLYPINGI
jgi:hypothetical protein